MPNRLNGCCAVRMPLIAERGFVHRPDDGPSLGRFALGHSRQCTLPPAVSRCSGPAAISRVSPLTTYLLRLDGDPSDELARFIERAQAIEQPETPRPAEAVIPITRRKLTP